MSRRPPPPSAAAADDPGAYRGAAVAHQVCARCHNVGAGEAPAQDVGAPDFRDIATHGLASRADAPNAADRAITASNLGAWMRAHHPDMPNYMLGEADIADLAAYIASLRTSD